MNLLTVGIVGTSNKENEHRVPIHPDHIENIEEVYRKKLFFQKGYGEPFGVSDKQIESLTNTMLSREEIFKKTNVVLLPKPVAEDFNSMEYCGDGHIVFNNSNLRKYQLIKNSL